MFGGFGTFCAGVPLLVRYHRCKVVSTTALPRWLQTSLSYSASLCAGIERTAQFHTQIGHIRFVFIFQNQFSIIGNYVLGSVVILCLW